MIAACDVQSGLEIGMYLMDPVQFGGCLGTELKLAVKGEDWGSAHT